MLGDRSEEQPLQTCQILLMTSSMHQIHHKTACQALKSCNDRAIQANKLTLIDKTQATHLGHVMPCHHQHRSSSQHVPAAA